MIELLETDRLLLRLPERDDHLILRDLVADPEVHRFLGPRPADPTTDMFSRAMRAAGSWFLHGYGLFLAFEKGSGAFVGQLGVFHTLRGFGKGLDDTAEAGWIVAREHWGKGYAEEGMRRTLAWFDDAQAKRRVACMIETENAASLRLARKLGFVRYADHVMDDGATLQLLERLRRYQSAAIPTYEDVIWL